MGRPVSCVCPESASTSRSTLSITSTDWRTDSVASGCATYVRHSMACSALRMRSFMRRIISIRRTISSCRSRIANCQRSAKSKCHCRGNACAHNAQWPGAMKPVIVDQPLREQRSRQHSDGCPSRNQDNLRPRPDRTSRMGLLHKMERNDKSDFTNAVLFGKLRIS